MLRTLGSLACGSLMLVILAVSANATPIAGASLGISHSFKPNGGGLFTSSLNGNGGGSSGPAFHNSGNGGHITSFSPHQFSLRVPPPVESETPEPSTLTLFGTGIMMLGGAVRRKFSR